MSDTVRPPEGFTEEQEDQLTNFDYSITPGLADRLRDEEIYCHHFAAEFCGDVWWQNGQFHESVYRFHVFVAHCTAPTLRELMTKVNNEHGWE